MKTRTCLNWAAGAGMAFLLLGDFTRAHGQDAAVDAVKPPESAAAGATTATVAAAITTPAGDRADEVRYELRTGDRLRFRIEEDPATGKDPLLVAVNSVGEASFPVSRESDIRVTMPVRGKTLRQVKEALGGRLLEEYYNRATIELSLEEKVLTPGKVQIFGQMQGTIPILPDQPPLYLSEAILQMGAPEFADLKRIKIHRVDPVTQVPKTIEVDVRSIIKGGARGKDLVLQDGDRVEVPQKWIN